MVCFFVYNKHILYTLIKRCCIMMLDDLIKQIKSNYASDECIVVKKIHNNKLAILYMEGISDVKAIADYIVKPLSDNAKLNKISVDKVQSLITYPNAQIIKLNEVIESLNGGKCIIIVGNTNKCIACATDIVKERNISEPPTSAVLKGPREGFVENYKTNVVLIKQILADSNVATINLKVGVHTNTNIIIVYINGISDKKVVDKVVDKIKKIDIDGIIDSNYITSFLEEYPGSIFKQIGTNEKPDAVVAKMLEGRVAIIVDGSPIVLTVPFVLFEDIQSSDDYYTNNWRASLLRWLRLACCLITILLPAIYLSVQLYHYKVLPLTFLITIINSTQNIPFTPFMEIMFVLILFEILYEASLRMPQYLGIALSIVGALILGDTAVEAGLISSPAVMIVALSGITLYTIPDHTPQLSILRFAYTIIGGILGFYGIIVFSIFLLIRLNDFDAFGSPYLAPYSPYIRRDIKDGMFKQHLTHMYTRPKTIPNKNKVRLRK